MADPRDPLTEPEDNLRTTIPPPAPALRSLAGGSPEFFEQFAPMSAEAAPESLTASVLAAVPLAPLPEVDFAFSGHGPGWSVRGFTASEAISSLYEVTVDLAHDHVDEDPTPLLGQRAQLTLSRGEHRRRFVGIVRRVQSLGVAHGRRVATAIVVPALWALTQRVDSRIFQDLNALDIVRQVLSDAGVYVDAVDVRIERELAVREYCVQHRESDYEFVRRLLADEGIAFHFEHAEGGERLVLCDNRDAYTASPSFDGAAAPIVGPEARTHATETVRHFDLIRELQSTSVTGRDYDFTRPDLDLTRASPRAAGERPVYEFPAESTLSRYRGQAYAADDLQAQVELRAEALEHRDQRVVGESSVTTLTPGFTFEVNGHGVSALDGRYVVTRVTHRGRCPEELAEAAGLDGGDRDRYRNEFECAPATRMPRPERVTQRPRVHGLQTAKVVGPAGEEIYTDEHGRIKVQFPWDRAGRCDERSSCWMRVMQLWGGAGWGFVFIPRVGMEVLVQFVEGNPDRPVVIGSTYNGTHAPPYPLPDQKTRSTLKTQSSPHNGGYNELRFEDMAGGEEVYLQAQKDFNELVKHDHTTTVRHDQTNAVTANQTETVGGTQSMTVDGNRTKTLHGDETVVVDGDRTETVHGNERITVDKSRTLTVTQKETETFHGDREATVRSLDKLTVNGDSETTINGGDKTVTVHGEYNTTADTQFHVTQGGDHLFIKDAFDLRSVGGLKLYNARTTIEMTTGGVVSVTASDEIRLTCGAASIALKKDGTISIRGAKEVGVGSGASAVKVEPPGVNVSGPKINAAAVGVHEISGALIKIN